MTTETQVPPRQNVSPNELLRRGSKRKLTTLNLAFILGSAWAVLFIIALIVVSLWHATHASAPTNDVVTGGPQTTQGSTAQSVGYTNGRTQAGDDGGDTTSLQATPQPHRASTNTTTTTTTTTARSYSAPPPAPAARAASAGGGAAGTSGGAGASAASDSSDRRATQQQAAEAQRAALEREEERTELASHSLGGVTVVGEEQAVTDRADGSSSVVAATSAREYPAPSGPVLALDTKVPTQITQPLDSTFQGQVALPIAADVLDETGTKVLIPSGSVCYGKSSSGAVDGQARLLVVATLCKLPNRTRLALDNFPVVDVDGATGLKARVDDHGAGRRRGGSMLGSLPGMLAGTVVPGVGGSIVSGAATSAINGAGNYRATPGPTLYVDASPEHPRAFSILVTADTAVPAYGEAR